MMRPAEVIASFFFFSLSLSLSARTRSYSKELGLQKKFQFTGFFMCSGLALATFVLPAM